MMLLCFWVTFNPLSDSCYHAFSFLLQALFTIWRLISITRLLILGTFLHFTIPHLIIVIVIIQLLTACTSAFCNLSLRCLFLSSFSTIR